MRVFRLTSSEDKEYASFEAIYSVSFPVFEQRTEEQQQRAFASSLYHLDGYSEEDELIGFMAYWEFDAYIYVEHFAIKPGIRGRGYGGQILSDVKERTGKRILLEIDPVTDEISAARLRFYELHGFVSNSHAHTHPAYRKGYEGHPLTVLTTNDTLSANEYQQFNRDLKEIVMNIHT